MFIPFKVILAVVLAVVAPILFYKFSGFLARVFLGDDDSSEKWHFFVRLNRVLVIAVYLLVGAGIAITVSSYLTESNDAEKSVPGEIIAAELPPSEKIPGTNSQIAKTPDPSSNILVETSNVSSSEITLPETGKIQPQGITPQHQPEPEETAPDIDEAKDIRIIRLVNGRKFGVNWITVEEGLKITRLSPGPMKTAGLEIGDIIAYIDDSSINKSSELLNMRDEIHFGKHPPVILTVLRGDEEFFYRLTR